MCMLIWHPAGAVPFTREEFVDFHRKNRQGFGAIWRAPSGEIRYKKGLMSIEETWPMYKRLLANGCTEMVLHWRLATAGRVSSHNCHPIPVGDVLLMHNGVLAHRSTPTVSDTRMFARDELEPDLESEPWLIHDKKWCARLEQKIGQGNKMILWSIDDAKPVIVGERRGLWYKGKWFSNTYAWTVPADARRNAMIQQDSAAVWSRGPKIDWHGLYGSDERSKLRRLPPAAAKR